MTTAVAVSREIAYNPKFRQKWEDLQRMLGGVLLLTHMELDEVSMETLKLNAEVAQLLLGDIVKLEPTEGPKRSHG